MKHRLSLLPALALICLLTACGPTPEKCFDVAVLNTNLITGFADNGFLRQIDEPSARLVPGTKDQVEPMKRKEVIEEKVAWTTENLERIKGFSQNDDNRDMIQASIKLHEYILPVYKNEYTQLAKMYDDGVEKAGTLAVATEIHDKYSAGYQVLLDKLIVTGKAFAAKHQIVVNWHDN